VHQRGELATVLNPPTLEELIEACGDEFVGVRNFDRECERAAIKKYRTSSEKHDDAVDALIYLILGLGLVGDGVEEQKVHYV
jgi:hypothetical protein